MPVSKPVVTPNSGAKSMTVDAIEYGPDDAFASIRHNRNTKLENQKLALHLLDATEAVKPLSFFSVSVLMVV